MTYLGYVSNNQDFFDYSHLSAVYYKYADPKKTYSLQALDTKTDSSIKDFNTYKEYKTSQNNKYSLQALDTKIDNDTQKNITQQYVYQIPTNNINYKIKSITFNEDKKVASLIKPWKPVELSEKSNNILKDLPSFNFIRIANHLKSIANSNEKYTLQALGTKLDNNFNIGKIKEYASQIPANNLNYKAESISFNEIRRILSLMRHIKPLELSERSYEIFENLPKFDIIRINDYIKSITIVKDEEIRFFERAIKLMNRVIYPDTKIPEIGMKKYRGRYF